MMINTGECLTYPTFPFKLQIVLDDLNPNGTDNLDATI